MKKAESRLQRKIKEALEKEFPGIFVFKVHGSMYQEVGIPDLIGCYRGIFFGIEVKEPGEEPTPIQNKVLRRIKEAGGICGVAETPEEAIKIIKSNIINDLP